MRKAIRKKGSRRAKPKKVAKRYFTGGNVL
jgi:hypothetical protein